MNEPLVTVITPVFNAEKYLQETINSVRHQTYSNFEHILIDDASQDNSYLIAKLHEKARWIVNPKNIGEAESVNIGLKAARGKYVIVLNADDLIYPNLILECVQILENNPNKVLVYPDWDMIDGYGGLITTIKTREYSRKELVEDFHCFPGPGAVFRNLGNGSHLRNGNYKYVSDYDFWLQLSNVGDFQRLPVTSAAWRKHGSGASSGRNLAMANERIKVIESYFQNEMIYKQFNYKFAISAAYYHAARIVLFDENIPAFRLVVKSIIYRPKIDKHSSFKRPFLLTALLLIKPVRILFKFVLNQSISFYLLTLLLGEYLGLEFHEFIFNSLQESRNCRKKTVKHNSILIIGMFGSVHFQGWLKELRSINAKFFFLDSDISKSLEFRANDSSNRFRIGNISPIKFYFRNFLKRLFKSYPQSFRIQKAMAKSGCEILHIHEIQSGAYPLIPILKHPKSHKPKRIIVSSWGSDLSFYGHLNSEKFKLAEVMSFTDILTVENQKEYKIAYALDYKGPQMPNVLNSGLLKTEEKLSNFSEEKFGIIIKGYQDIHGRALTLLSVLERIVNDIAEPIWVFSASPEVVRYVEYLRSNTTLNIMVISTVGNPIEKAAIANYFKKARIYLGCAISDGASTSMLEAMSNRCLVLQSGNSLADELIEDNKNGFLIDWKYPELIEKKLLRAMRDYNDFQNEIKKNEEVIKKKFDAAIVATNIKKIYQL